MKKFTKGNLTTYVDDNDRRIADYRSNGWTEETVESAKVSIEDEVLGTAINDANDSEADKKKKNGASSKKVNSAIKAKTTAAAESAAVDDGLIKESK